MADLILNEDRKQYQDLARDFAQNEIAPRAHEFDISGNFPLDICKKAWEIGLLNVRMPEDLGGLGLGVLDAVVIGEELAAGCAGISAAIMANDLALAPLLVAGTDAQKKEYLDPLMSRFGLAGYCLPPQAEHESLSFTHSGDDFVLNGEATCVNASHADWLVAYASGAAPTAFVLHRSVAGLSIGEKLPALGLKASDIRQVKFKNVSLKNANVIGEEGAGGQLLRTVQALTDPLVAAYAVGIARCALENAVRYSKERQTMGKPIGQHQAVGFMLADLAKEAEAGRLLARKAAWLCDAGVPDAGESMTAKTFASESTMRGTTDAVQVYGGYGYSREYPVEKLMRDAKALQIYFAPAMAAKLALGKQLVGACQ